MNTIRCSECNKLLAESASYCSNCGVSMSAPEYRSSHARSQRGDKGGRALNGSAAEPTAPSKLTLRNHAAKRQKNTTNFPVGQGIMRPLDSSFHTSSRLGTTPLWENSEALEEEPSDEWQAIKRPATWHKNVALLSNRANAVPLPPRPARTRPPMWNAWRRICYRIPPTAFVWISLLVFLSLIFGGASGIMVTLGHSTKNAISHSTILSLQATPSSAAVGATVMLTGENFTPYGKIGLMRDTSLPVLDTANAALIDADNDGNFTDTIAITPDWEAGAHTLNAEDAFRHKVASFTIMVTGHATSLRPAHLHVSANELNLGSGDQATNTNKSITLANIGGGVISWQGSSTQPWIVFSPASGTIVSNHSAQVIVAIDRSKLNIGSYSAQINIFSSGGNSSVSVKATVTALLQDQRAILQSTSSILSFTAIDGGPSPATQVINVSNSGLRPLSWQATTNTNWLSISPQSTTLNLSDSQSVTVAVNSSLLLPGTYQGVIKLSALGTNDVVGNPQTIFVTVTVIPQCFLQVTPGQLSFTSIYQQAPPTAETISIETSLACSTPIAWHAISNANWLRIDATSGDTLASPKVSLNISGLLPDVYSSSIIFSSATGTQTLPVSLIVEATCMFTITPNILTITGIAGQTASTVQRQVALLPNASCAHTLNWGTTVATSHGGNWLSASPNGNANSLSSGIINVNAALANRKSGDYTGTITITATDSVTKRVIGMPQVVQVFLNIQPVCTLQTPSATQKAFATTAGSNPPSQMFTLSVMGTCPGVVAVVPDITFISGTGWLSIAADTTTIASGGSATFTIIVTTHGLAVGTYRAAILLSAINASVVMANSSQRVDVTLNVGVPPAPIATPTPTPIPTPVPSPVSTATATT